MVPLLIFWACFLIGTLFLILNPKRIAQRLVVFAYFGSVIISFWAATLIHTRRYILRVLEGNLDAALSLIWCQSAINPLRLLFGTGLGSPAEWSFPIVDMVPAPVHAVIYMLWEIFVDDLFFGTVFWVTIVSLVIVHTSRRVGDA